MSVPANLFGDPSNALLSFAWQPVQNVPATSGWHDVEFKGETMGNKVAALERQAITSAGMMSPALDGKRDSGGDPSWDTPNPDELAYILAALMGKGAAPVTVEAGAYRHKLSRLESAVTFPSWMTARVWRNDGMAQRFHDVEFSSLEISFAAKALLNTTVKTVATVADYWDDAVKQGSGTGTAIPQIRGISALNFDASATASNLWVKVTATASGTVTVKTKVGNATSYGSGTQVITRGVWTQLLDQAGIRIGDNATPVQIYYPASGSIDAATPDEFKILWTRDQWAPVFADPTQVVSEVYSRVYVNGIESELQGGKLTITKPAEAMFGFGGQDARRTRTRGSQSVKLDFNREYLDLRVRTLVETGAPFSVVLDLQSRAPLGTSGALNFGIKGVGLNLRSINSTTASATSKDKSDESISAAAYPSTDGTYPSDWTWEVLNSIPDLSV